MFKTHEISIGPIFRTLIGMSGVVATISGFALAVWELWLALQGKWLSLLAAAFFLIVLAGGVSLLRSAIRGRLSVRSYQKSKH